MVQRASEQPFPVPTPFEARAHRLTDRPKDKTEHSRGRPRADTPSERIVTVAPDLQNVDSVEPVSSASFYCEGFF